MRATPMPPVQVRPDPVEIGTGIDITAPELMSRPGSLRQASTRPRSRSVMTESHSTRVPAGPLTTQCERSPSRGRTSSTIDMNRGKFS